MDTDQIHQSHQLPHDVIHHILSFLPTTRDLVRVSVLSKAWYSSFACFPVSDFSLQSSSSLNPETFLQFGKFVHSSLHRQSLHYKCIPRFKLRIPIYSEYPQLFVDLIDSSVLLSRQFGVRELSLLVPLQLKYKLTEAIFAAKEFPLPDISWLSLRVFALGGVDISDQKIIENLIFTCPFIEKLSLIYCSGIKQLRLLGFTKLKEVLFKDVRFRDIFSDDVQRVDIDALSLQTFSYFGRGYETNHIDLKSCKNLEVLKFEISFITDSIIQDINSKFPVLTLLALSGNAHGIKIIELSCLEELDLSQYHAKAITINAPCLEKLYLSTYLKEAIVINAPRLKSFHCSLVGEISFSLSLNKNSLKKVFLVVSLENIYAVNGCDFLKSLMKNFGNFNEISQVTWYIEDLKWIHQIVSNIPIPALLHIKHLELRICLYEVGRAREEESQALVDVLFCFCHPESLLLECVFGDPKLNDEFIKLLCKNLIYNCLATNGKCWQHDFKGIVKIEHIDVLPCDALLDSLPTIAPKDKIRFVFKW